MPLHAQDVHYTVRYPNNFYDYYRNDLLKIGLTEYEHPQIMGQTFLCVSYLVNDGLDRVAVINELKEYLDGMADAHPEVKLTHYQSNESFFILSQPS
ncbi:hypothetical protein [Erwinia rhapontici]|uniref:hypothetical protein n=1 Tax=Erwinia rhapontici TaxID=55212 RepID=UPI001331C195|nr:hypothetical protein [Erwinia rhapontici]MBP2155737.1 hypothetical protein [Erwinia rhapontici]